MPRRLLVYLLLGGLTTTLAAQELTLSTAAKTYANTEQVWVNLSVNGAAALPGAYKFDITYSADKLSFLGTQPADKGPFAITPAAAARGNIVSVAGFQGIADTGRGTASLVTLVFTPKTGSVAIDTGSFSIGSKEVYSTQAAAMDLTVIKQMTSVLLPAPDHQQAQKITIAGNYIKFSLPHDGTASITIFDLNGRTVATPLASVRCRAGYQAVPVGKSLRSGIYIVAVRGTGLNATKKMEVVR